MSDYGFREYNTLRTRVLGAGDYRALQPVAVRITNFVQDEDNSPVYCETLVNMLMVKGYDLLAEMNWQSLNYDTMVARLITNNVRATVLAWQGTMRRMENHAEG